MSRDSGGAGDGTGVGAGAGGEIFPELILLCGGRSSRLGEPKGLVSVDGRPWLAQQLAAASRAGVRRAIVVLGFWSERYLAARAEWERPDGPRVDLVVNPAPERGAFSSLVCGAARATDAAFVLPIDVPCPGPAVWRALADARGGRAVPLQVVIPSHAGRGGHPILASAAFLRSLQGDEPDSRLDAKIRATSPALVARVPVTDPRVLLNLNTREDWERRAAETTT